MGKWWGGPKLSSNMAFTRKALRNFTYHGDNIIDDYAKDGGPGEVQLCAVFTMSICALELKQMLISLLFQVIRLLN